MNRMIPRSLILAFVVLTAANGLFPPFYGEEIRSGDNPQRFIGYHFVLGEEPSPVYVRAALLGSRSRDPLWTFRSRIDLVRYLVQQITITLVCLAPIVFLPSWRVRREGGR